MNLAGTALSTALSRSKSKKPKAKMTGMHVMKGASGGYIAKHDMDDGSQQSHAIPNMEALQKHMMEHMPEGSY